MFLPAARILPGGVLGDDYGGLIRADGGTEYGASGEGHGDVAAGVHHDDSPVAAGLCDFSDDFVGRLPRSFMVELDAVADARGGVVANEEFTLAGCGDCAHCVFGI